MFIKNFKKLTSTVSIISILTVNSVGFSTIGYANGVTAHTLTGNSTGGTNGINTNATLAVGDTVSMGTFSLTITQTDATTPLDTSITSLGAITATTGVLTLAQTSVANSNFNATSYVASGAGAVAITSNTAGAAVFFATFSGDVTTAGGTLAITADTDSVFLTKLNLKGNLTATTILDDTAANGTTELVFNGSSTQTVTGTINAQAAGEGVLTISNTSNAVTIASAVGATQRLNSVIVDTAANSVEFQGAVSSTTLNLRSGSKTTFLNNGHIVGNGGVGSLILSGADKAVINVGRGVVAGETLFNATGVVAGVTGVMVTATTFNLPSNFADGVITLIDTNLNGTVSTDEVLLMSATNTPLTSFAITHTGPGENTTQDVIVTATAKSDATTASELGVNTNKATGLRAAVLAAATQGTDTTLIDAFTTVLNAGTSTDTAIANQAAPQTDIISGSVIASQVVTSGVQNVMSTRMASLRSGDGYTSGVVTGNGMSVNSGFIQAFGSSVEQKNKGNEFGYDADTTGFAVGFDTKVSNGSVIGISYANSSADVDGKGTGLSKNKIKTDAFSLYTDYATAKGYVEASITYGQSDNDTSRVITEGGLARSYSANYDSEQYSLRLFGGMPQDAGNGMFVTPYVGATISQIKADAYTERSTTTDDALRLRVNQDTVDSQVGSIGVKYHQVIKDGNTTFTPEIKVAVNQEFGDGSITTTNTYQGGGASFKNSTDVEKTSGTAGIGLSIASDNITFNISYDVDVKDQYLGHGAQAKLSAKF